MSDFSTDAQRVVDLRTASRDANLSLSTMRRLIRAGQGPRILRLSPRRLGVWRADLDGWLSDRAIA